ncbi:hypothetical protein BO70DRAFT_397576 [Aspergillus heteromorphus CBS 117.55]|uniref:F-box domain-containing protein n=1 Tax=Aspergillus heteromorphus CBS 117.55 TaxID=1448321 RepID=A0A317VZH3_9EURO|nr:uncharacterized protein BO70DRAFT_397576 [Aspergillus heteromorphus CBS 117.55]PWY78338.1 hypothetical protein BO70DRAFT_397576 [Aspergillus heteromorphus CBS 117.55]
MAHFDHPDSVIWSDLCDALTRLPFPSEGGESFGFDSGPYEEPSLEQFLQSQREQPRCNPEVEKTLAGRSNPSDLFRCLPLEIIEATGALLPTHDALKSRLVSRSLGVLFHSLRFWKTRFDINAERGFLNYFLREGQAIDWRLLYHSTCIMRCGRSFDAGGGSLMEFGGRALQHYHHTSWPGHYSRAIRFPPDLVQIGFSAGLERGGDWNDIKGLELIRRDGPNILLGSKVPGARVVMEEEPELQHFHQNGSRMIEHDLTAFYTYPGIHVLLDARSLRGVSFDRQTPGRVIGIQLLRSSGDSASVGHGESTTYAEGYSFNKDEPVELNVTFDLHGLVHLGVRGYGSVQMEPHFEAGLIQNFNFRDLWFSSP